MRKLMCTLLAMVGAACGASRPPSPAAPTGGHYGGGDAPHSQAADRMMLAIPAGPYIAGSTPEERARAYDDSLATSGRDSARKLKWFDREEDRHQAELPGFRIDQQPVTQAAYAEFVRDTKAALPFVDEQTWRKQGFIQRYETQVMRMNWLSDAPPPGREDHPVVLITWDEAAAYCAWRGALVGEPRRLPTAAEFEKAARGDSGLTYPWGNEFDPDKLNSQVKGPLDTTAVGTFPDGASPYHMLDAAGNVFQWTSTPWPHARKRDTMTVKGSAWDDFGGLGRGAAQHGRGRSIRHVLVGFRCAADAPGHR